MKVKWWHITSLLISGAFCRLPAQSLSPVSPVQSQWSQLWEAEIGGAHLNRTAVQTEASTWFDVTYYRLDLNIATAVSYLKGNVTVAGVCRTDSANILTLDLVKNMLVDSVLVEGKSASFVQNSSSFDIHLPREYRSNEVLSVDVFYEGIPIATGLGSFTFDSHDGVPWVYSLSEPYGAKDWWPCKDDPGDKADSADIIVTCDSTFKVGSEGVLASVANNGDGTSTVHWKERYPIASYLISVALTNYAQFSNWFRYSPTDSMQILNYVLPEHYADAVQNLPKVVDMLAVYSDLFGLYPFIKEKYGHAEFGRGGAMEHQTMTSTTTFDEDVLSHELAHQWFGDMITCRTWSDLWLNEGFAEYCSALYRERKYGMDSYWQYMTPLIDKGRLAAGEIGIADTSSAQNLFDVNRIYCKGACVLHMLRHVLGDSVFFRVLYAYANDPILRYATATIQDFQSVCESVSGKNLGYFFQEWIYGEGYPDYRYSWTWNFRDGSPAVTLTIDQTAGRSNPVFFTMPIDIRIKSAGRDTTLVVWNDSLRESYTIKYPVQPSTIILDSDGWILKSALSEAELPPSSYLLEQNFPNPFNSTTSIFYDLPRLEDVTLKIYDVLGREIATLIDSRQAPGVYKYQWTPRGIASGIYFYRLQAGSFRQTKKLVLLR
jgi:aminopeptidase N